MPNTCPTRSRFPVSETSGVHRVPLGTGCSRGRRSAARRSTARLARVAAGRATARWARSACAGRDERDAKLAPIGTWAADLDGACCKADVEPDARPQDRHRACAVRVRLHLHDLRTPRQRPTNEQTNADCHAPMGSPKAPASTSDNHAGSRSSRTTSTTCPADSTTGHGPTGRAVACATSRAARCGDRCCRRVARLRVDGLEIRISRSPSIANRDGR